MEDFEYTVETYRTEKAIITVRRPILPPEEREKRMEAIRRAAERFLLSVWAQEDEKKRKEASTL